MRVEYQVKVNEAVFEGEGEPTKDVDVVSVIFCCAEMQENWEKANVFLDEHDEVICISLARDYDDVEYEGYSADGVPIKFCPWCGKPVKAVKLRTVKTIFDPASPERLPATYQGKLYMVLNYKRATMEVIEDPAKV